MPRAIWSGSISFGLVNIPVRLYSAVSRKTVRFNQIDSATGARVKQKRVSALDGEEVPYQRIVKGYELPSGDFVTLTEQEMASVGPEMVRTIDIAEFVDLVDIDPIFYDHAYYLVPAEQGVKPYKLLVEAMGQSEKVAIGHFVMRSKQYLAAVRPRDGRLLLSTMVYADEIVDHAEIDGFDMLADVSVGPREQAMAEQLIATLDTTFDPTRHRDTYRDAILELIDRKTTGGSGETMTTPESSADNVIDLIAALEASVAEAKKSRHRHRSSRAPGHTQPVTESPDSNDDMANAQTGAPTEESLRTSA